MSDRTVHAECGAEKVVRYDRAGKWFVEFDPPMMRPCRRVTLAEAVAIALEMQAGGGVVYLHRPGGGAFDRKARAGPVPVSPPKEDKGAR